MQISQQTAEENGTFLDLSAQLHHTAALIKILLCGVAQVLPFTHVFRLIEVRVSFSVETCTGIVGWSVCRAETAKMAKQSNKYVSEYLLVEH